MVQVLTGGLAAAAGRDEDGCSDVDAAEAAFWASSNDPVEGGSGSGGLSSAAIGGLLRERAEAQHGYGTAAYYRACEY